MNDVKIKNSGVGKGENFESKIDNFCVANPRDSLLLCEIRTFNYNILNLNLFRPDLVRDSLRRT
jgi:hypothetical protein